jgi:diguanylate cyclase (GGDEF)-like protein/PAS domain S-box-containing protein
MVENVHPDPFATLRQRAEEMLQWQPEELREMSPEDIQDLIHELQVHQIELEVQNEELRRTQRELELSRDRYLDLYDFAPVGYFTLSQKGLILQANLTSAALLGVGRRALLKVPFSHFILPDDQDVYYFHRQEVLDTRTRQSCDLRLVKQDGTPFYARLESTVAQDVDGNDQFRVTITDITARKRAEEALRALSLVDELTGLYNRRGFLTLGKQQLKLAGRTKKKMLLLFADTDDLKRINDTLGHPQGDQALIDIAHVLRETFRESDIIARIGGDEFVVLAPETDHANPEILAARLQRNLEAYNASGDRPYRLSLSVGVARYAPQHPCYIDELLAQADRLMYEQKQGNLKP